MSAADHLDRFAVALAEAGWSSRSRYEEAPAALRVWDPRWPRYGDTITVTGDEGWFRSSTGALLAPVSDLPGAVARFEAQMEEFRPIVERLGLREPGRRGRLGGGAW